MERFKQQSATGTEAIRVFERVNSMTPESIHLDSFMYEPILDLSAQHLKKPYRQLCAM